MRAVVVDSDVVKSTLLEANVEWDLAGPAAYEVLFALADDLLGQGHSVILDSPSHYAFIPENGQRVAHKHDVPYRFIELSCHLDEKIRRRLAQRRPRRSQMVGLDQWPAGSGGGTHAKQVGAHQWETARPNDNYITLDTSESFDAYYRRALRYLAA